MPEYYLTGCEREIFTDYKKEIADMFIDGPLPFNLIELGAGDGTKTKILLQHLVQRRVPFTYKPVDISKTANETLIENLKDEIPALPVNPITGDFFQVLKHVNGYAATRKVVLFLGSNIGNFSEEELMRFLSQLKNFTREGDKVLIGFDLKKEPGIIRKAYNDSSGHTRDFNLNYLARMNSELEADFDINLFEQHSSYNPETGAVKSYLISKSDQTVNVGALNCSFHFKKWETVFMELSRKFDWETIEKMATASGFEVEKQFTDKRKYFTDSLWVRKS